MIAYARDEIIPATEVSRNFSSVFKSLVDGVKESFGKYKGQIPAQVAQTDPDYLTWLLNNAERLDSETRKEISNVLNA